MNPKYLKMAHKVLDECWEQTDCAKPITNIRIIAKYLQIAADEARKEALEIVENIRKGKIYTAQTAGIRMAVKAEIADAIRSLIQEKKA